MSYEWQKNSISGEPELVISGWENGIGASPEKGLNIKNCNIESVPGTVRPNWKLNQQTVPNNTSFTFTADPSTDVITLSGTGATTTQMYLQMVQVTTTGTLPTTLNPGTNYWLVTSGGFGSGQYKIATSLANAVAGTTLDLTSAGTGVQTIGNTAVPINTINYFVNIPITSSSITTYSQFALDSKGQVWYLYASSVWVLVLGNTSTTDQNGATGHGIGNGLAWFQSSGIGGTITSYLFVIGGHTIDVLNVSTFITNLVPTWNTSWMTLNAQNDFLGSHFAHLAQDNKIYICDTSYIAQIAEIAAKNFDPTDATTYTQNNQALSLPTYSQAQCLEELATNLLIGDMNTNRIYPWDKQATNFGQPLRVAENNIWRMKNVDNTIYCLAGTKGHIYQTTGYAFTREMKIPEYLSGGQVGAWGGIEKLSGTLIFGVSPAAFDAASAGNAGVYKLYTNVGQFQGSVVGSLICDETPLDVNGTATNATALLTDNVPDEFYYIGCAGAIYHVNTTDKLASYEAYVESDLIPVGTFLQNRTFQSIEYKLDYAPTSGGVRLSWRPDLNTTYSLIKDFNCAGVMSDLQTPANITDVQFLQIKAELKGGTGFNTPRLRELRLR